MSTQQTMNTIIHAAFRRDLARFDQALASFPAGSRDRANQLFVAWENVAFQLHHHHEDEENIFWPAFRELGADEALVGDLDGEHQRMLTALDVADAEMKAFRTDPTAERAQAARAAISDLSDVLLDHLAHEEQDLEPFAISHHDTPQVKAALKAVRRAHKGHAGTFVAWLTDGADAQTVAALRDEIPPPVLFVMSKVGGRRYHREIAPTWS
jgi:Hemerythrin HHE cation binding domain